MANDYSVKYIFEAVDKMSRNLKTIESNIKGLGLGMMTAEKKAKTFSEKMTIAGTKLRSFGNSMRYVSLAVAGIGAASIRNFAKIEKGLTNVQGLLEREDVPKYSNKLKQMQEESIKLGFSLDDANDSLFKSVSFLEMGKQASETFTEAQKLAIGGNSGLATSVAAISSIINAYGRETVKASDVSNAFFSAQVKGATDVQQLAENIGKVAPIAVQAGIGFKELLATTSALTLGGLDTEMATTALRAAISGLTKPGAQARKILDRLGISYGRTNLQAKGLKTVLWQIIKANEKYPNALDMAIPNIRAATGLFALTSERIAMVDKAMVKINRDIEEGSGLQDSYNRMMKSTDIQLKRIKGSLSIISSIIGEQLAPYVKMVNDKLVIFTNRIENLPSGIKKIVSLFAGMLALTAPLALGIGWIAKALGSKVLITAGSTILILASAFAILAYDIDLVNRAMKDFKSAFWENIRDIGKIIKYLPMMKIPGSALEVFGNYMLSNVVPKQEVPNEWVTLFKNWDVNRSIVDINLNAPKGTVKNYSSVTDGARLNLGVNMGY